MKRALKIVPIVVLALASVAFWRYEPPRFTSLAPSPNGDLLALTVQVGDCPSMIVVHDRTTGTTKELRDEEGAAWRDPAFAPDGQYIVAASRRDSETESELIQMDMRGQRRQTLASGPGRWMHPSFSPDGSRIAFVNELEYRGAESGSGLPRTVGGIYVVDLHHDKRLYPVYESSFISMSKPFFVDNVQELLFSTFPSGDAAGDVDSPLSELTSQVVYVKLSDPGGHEILNGFYSSPVPFGGTSFVFKSMNIHLPPDNISYGWDIFLRKDANISRMTSHLRLVVGYELDQSRESLFILADREFVFDRLPLLMGSEPYPKVIMLNIESGYMEDVPISVPMSIRNFVCRFS